MKTLKDQILVDTFDSDMELTDRSRVITLDDALKRVRMWLKQKRQYYRTRKNETDREANTDLSICLFINELLDELGDKKE